jgi:hypothetical protein
VRLNYERRSPEISGFTKSMGAADINTSKAAILKIRQLPHNTQFDLCCHTRCMTDPVIMSISLLSILSSLPAPSYINNKINAKHTFTSQNCVQSHDLFQFITTEQFPQRSMQCSVLAEPKLTLIYCIVFFFEIQKFIHTQPWDTPII